MSYQQSGTCWHCGHTLNDGDYARDHYCSSCGKPTLACRNCEYFSTSAPNQCREPVADPVSDKERSNFCGYFKAIARNIESQNRPTEEDLKAAAEALFKDL